MSVDIVVRNGRGFIVVFQHIDGLLKVVQDMLEPVESMLEIIDCLYLIIGGSDGGKGGTHIRVWWRRKKDVGVCRSLQRHGGVKLLGRQLSECRMHDGRHLKRTVKRKSEIIALQCNTISCDY